MSNRNNHEPDQSGRQAIHDVPYAPITRRSFLKFGAAAAGAWTGLSLALTPLKNFKEHVSLDEFLQQHYQRLTPEMMNTILKRIEREIERDYGVNALIEDC